MQLTLVWLTLRKGLQCFHFKGVYVLRPQLVSNPYTLALTHYDIMLKSNVMFPCHFHGYILGGYMYGKGGAGLTTLSSGQGQCIILWLSWEREQVLARQDIESCNYLEWERQE